MSFMDGAEDCIVADDILGAPRGEGPRAFKVQGLPIVSIVVPCFGVTKNIIRIQKGNPKKELQWRL